jgi:hypothetical protein
MMKISKRNMKTEIQKNYTKMEILWEKKRINGLKQQMNNNKYKYKIT